MRARLWIAILSIPTLGALAPLSACDGRTQLDRPDDLDPTQSTAPSVSAPAPHDAGSPPGATPDAPVSCECVAGETDERTCDGDALQRRTCEDGCHFTTWSACAVHGWLPMSSPKALHLVLGSPRVMVWTGHEVLVWSGVGAREYADTAAYDPATDRWSLRARSPIVPSLAYDAYTPFRVPYAFVEGRLWLLETGSTPQPLLHAYDPITDAWSTRPVKDFPIRLPYSLDSFTWVQATRELVALRNEHPTTAFAFNIDDATVRVLEPPYSLGKHAAFIGSELWVCCGVGSLQVWSPTTNTWRVRDKGPPGLQFTEEFTLHDGASTALVFLQRPWDVDPGAAWGGSRWTSLDDAFVDVPSPPTSVLPASSYRIATMWSSDRAVYLWGGTADPVQTGASYELSSGRWRSMPFGGPDLPDAITVWTGDVAILFGGDQEGMRFRP